MTLLLHGLVLKHTGIGVKLSGSSDAQDTKRFIKLFLGSVPLSQGRKEYYTEGEVELQCSCYRGFSQSCWKL